MLFIYGLLLYGNIFEATSHVAFIPFTWQNAKKKTFQKLAAQFASPETT